MAEKTSTNVYRSVWVYLCISILFCIFHFQLKVDYFIDYQSSIFSHFRDPCNHAPTMADPPPAVLGEKAFSGCDAVVDLSFVLLLLLFCVFVLFHVELYSASASPPPLFRSHGGLPAPSPSCHQLWQSRGIFPEYSSPSKYLEVQMHFARILFPIKILMSSSPVVFCQNTFVKNCNITRIMSE